eukprot:TRINITY_DN40499_c0_g1_i1.p1 TRINITY_DN40499_c0_g1~~TRINITY_DN40499_c0_g1_i1.p1  ORF type:complete len:172 (+),score=22.17 TRINITY_DN40499_c0_g1_i1:171-686(+)
MSQKKCYPIKAVLKLYIREGLFFKIGLMVKNAFETVKGEVKKADLAEFKDKFDRKNIFNELDWITPELFKLELLNDEKVGTKDCYKVKATRNNGLVEILYFDKESKLLERSDKVENAEKNSFTTTLYISYKTVSGLTFASEIKMGDKDTFQTLSVVDLKINEDISDSDFKP